MTARLVAKNLEFSWTGKAPVLDIASFEVVSGERLFLKGPSGSGKSTLLGLVAGVLSPQRGTLVVNGQDMMRLSLSERDQLRAETMGVIFQIFNLVPYLTVLQNVALPCQFSKARKAKVVAAGGVAGEATRLLARLGLETETILNRKVTDLSVGQQQRVAAARALIGQPSLIIADEPTSAMDADTRDRFIDLLSEEVTASGAAMLFVSHDGGLAGRFDRAVDLSDINRAQQEALA